MPQNFVYITLPLVALTILLLLLLLPHLLRRSPPRPGEDATPPRLRVEHRQPPERGQEHGRAAQGVRGQSAQGRPGQHEVRTVQSPLRRAVLPPNLVGDGRRGGRHLVLPRGPTTTSRLQHTPLHDPPGSRPPRRISRTSTLQRDQTPLRRTLHGLFEQRPRCHQGVRPHRDGSKRRRGRAGECLGHVGRSPQAVFGQGGGDGGGRGEEDGGGGDGGRCRQGTLEDHLGWTELYCGHAAYAE
mmetsp:Transcript_20622/g.42882  ORF Transcript_20622/g.42882 Transcript_20622/m.42882 type:complete len:242 (+) Transcript_20622:223-948(+)